MTDNARDGHVIAESCSDIAVVRMSRPERRNAFDDAMIAEFVETLDRIGRTRPRVLVLTGEGPDSFSAGYDIGCMDPDQPSDRPLPDERFEPAVLAVERFPSPVVAAMNGDAFGGGLDLALACDFRIARRGIRVAMTPCRLGLVYAASGLKRFLGKLGGQTARRLFLTGERIRDDEALRLSIVDELVEAGDLMGRSMDLARTISENAPLAVSGMRRAIQGIEKGRIRDEKFLDELRELRRAAFASQDLREGLLAFNERRNPKFQGR